MKKINLLTPIFAMATTASVAMPLATSCTTTNTTITKDMLNIRGAVLYGLKESVDISQFTTLKIPEGVKFIEKNAFNGVFTLGTKGSKVRTVVFPTTLIEIRENAFADCTAIRKLDFSYWSVDQIYYCSFAKLDNKLNNGAFTGCLPGGQIVYNMENSKESRDELSSRLAYAGVWASWTLDSSDNKIQLANELFEQTVFLGKTTYNFKLAEKLGENVKLLATVTQCSASENVDVTSTSMILEPTGVFNYINLPVTLINHSKAGDYATFNVAFTAIKYTDEFGLYVPIWKQTLTGFKVINAGQLVEKVKLESEKIEVQQGEKINIKATALPENAFDKTFSYGSDYMTVATVDNEGVVTTHEVGEANIIVSANGGIDVTNSIKIKVLPKE